MNPLLKVDYYKTEHFKMYPENMTKLYSNFTPRKSRIKGVNKVVFFGLQHFILEYLIKDFNENFFGINEKSSIPLEHGGGYERTNKKEIIKEYSKHIKLDSYKHIEDLWDLGYLPIEIKALEEGTLCPIGVPCFTITNTHPNFAWLVNYLETLISCMMWQPITSATIAYEYKKLLNKYALETTRSIEGVEWQGHDFSMRGMSSIESSILSGMAHLTSFNGTDVIPAIYQLEDSYKAQGIIGASVPATEHSVMCMGTKESEIDTFKRLLDLYPTGILSVVSDTWDLWKVCTEYLPTLKEQILARDGKLVIRPDSGDPVDIICGKFLFIPHQEESEEDENETKRLLYLPEYKGVIELLWDIFGGTINKQGYKVLDSHIGAIYGDSITLERAKQICERLKEKGFASTNIIFGIGSYTYQYNTRDTFGFAMKATYGEITHNKPNNEDNWINIESREIFKDPITDDGTKRSKKGLLVVDRAFEYKDGVTIDHGLFCIDQQSWEQEQTGELKTIFKDGKLIKETTLKEIRDRLNNNITK